MNFLNESISPGDLPSIENVTYSPLERAYLKVQHIALIFKFLLFAIAGVTAFYFIKKFQTPIVMYSGMAALIIISVLNWIGNEMGFRYSGYALRDRDILFRSGWLMKKARVVPLNRVQHVSVQSGPLERKFGLASVSIFTAGSGSADFTIKGIKEDKAQQIKDWISNQLNGAIKE